MRKVIEVIYDDLSSFVSSDVIDWHTDGDSLSFRDESNPYKTTFVPICAIKSYSLEDVSDSPMPTAFPK